jgi:serine/threonine protein phosphatase PrpC
MAVRKQASAEMKTGGTFAQDVGFHVENASSVKEYAYTEDKNRQFRPEMEDTHCHVDRLNGDESCGLFCVFDGHGGGQVSEFAADTFAIELRKELQKQP